MTSTVQHTVGSGKEYSTLQLYADYADPLDFIALDTVQEGDLYTPSSSFSIAGTVATITAAHAVDATRYLVIKCATGQSFSDNANVRTRALYYNDTNGVAINDSSTDSSPCLDITGYSYLQLIGLQLQKAGSSSGRIIQFTSSNNVLINNCILTGGNGLYFPAGVTGAVVQNCLFVDSTPLNIGGTVTYYHCTFITTTASGSYTYSLGTTNWVNCAFFGSGNGAFDAGSPVANNFTNCMTDITGTTGLTGGLTFSSQFENTANDFRAKTGATLDNGSASQVGGITTDISGFTRKTNPTIGCWEVAGSSPTNLTIDMINRFENQTTRQADF